MATETIATAPKGNGKTELCRLKMSLNTERGFEIHLQSNHNFSFLSNPKDGIFKLGGVECFIPRNGDGSNLPGVAGYFSLAKDRYELEHYLNLSLLLAKDLQKGVTFNFGCFPISDDKINELASNWKQQVKMLYLSYMKPISVSVMISTETVEVEPHD